MSTSIKIWILTLIYCQTIKYRPYSDFTNCLNSVYYSQRKSLSKQCTRLHVPLVRGVHVGVTQCAATQMFSDLSQEKLSQCFLTMKKPRPFGRPTELWLMEGMVARGWWKSSDPWKSLFPDLGNLCSERCSCREGSEVGTSVTARWVPATWRLRWSQRETMDIGK